MVGACAGDGDCEEWKPRKNGGTVRSCALTLRDGCNGCNAVVKAGPAKLGKLGSVQDLT